MTIHHDKAAYGKLAKTSEELSEEKIAQMLKKLAGEDGDPSRNGEEGKKAEKDLTDGQVRD